jgi:hypothetical protein
MIMQPYFSAAAAAVQRRRRRRRRPGQPHGGGGGSAAAVRWRWAAQWWRRQGVGSGGSATAERWRKLGSGGGKWEAVAAAASVLRRRPAWRWQRQLGVSAALVAVAQSTTN